MSKLLWTQKQDIGPSPRFAHGMVFDAASQRVLLFGGDTLGGKLLSDTWAWDGEDWTQLEDIGPPARRGHAMAYDGSRNRTVLFGGTSGTSDFNDTWEWDGESWTQIQDIGPSPRAGHGMAYDAARARVVLFGGGPTDGVPLSDTWEWDGADWSQADDSGPSARSGHAMAFDSARSRTILFGGIAAGASIGLSDTWERDGTSWKHVQDIGPPGCMGAALVFRTSASALFGGISALANVAGRQLFDLTWEWNGQHWTARQDMGVGPRFGHAMAFDSSRARVVLFGGLGVPPDDQNAVRELKGDTWEHADVAAGSGPAPAPAPNPAPDGIVISSMSVQPNPAAAGTAVSISVQLQSASLSNVVIDFVFEGNPVPIGSLVIPAGLLRNAALFVIPDTPAQGVRLIAMIGGVARATTTMTIT